MTSKSKLYGIASVLLIEALVFLGVTWWINGRDDTWFYAICVITILTSFVPILSKKSRGKD